MVTFTARRYASAVYAVIVRLPSVCLSPVVVFYQDVQT